MTYLIKFSLHLLRTILTLEFSSLIWENDFLQMKTQDKEASWNIFRAFMEDYENKTPGGPLRVYYTLFQGRISL